MLALDALRGLAILLMLLVNNIGREAGTPVQLRHAGWEGGIHLADFAFPWFVFCAGAAVPFSVAHLMDSGVSVWRYELRVLRRVVVLLALGAVLDSVWDRRIELFTVGVLQTVALAYLITALLSELPAHRRVIFAAIGLLGYWAAMKWLPVPGRGAGEFTEHGNLVRHLNVTYFGQVGLWNLPRIVPATSLALIGSAIGNVLGDTRMAPKQKLRVQILSGIVLTGVAYLWSLSIPFNKPLWTPSYAVLSAGTAALLLALFYWTADMLGRRGWVQPLIVFGSNAILLYVAPILVKETLLRALHVSVSGWSGVTPFVVFWWLAAWVLYRKRIFLRV